MKYLIKSLEIVNNKTPLFLNEILKVLNEADKATWESQLLNNSTLFYKNEKMFIEIVEEYSIKEYQLEYSKEYDIWHIHKEPVDKYSSISLVEILVNKISIDLCSNGPYLDNNNRWRIDICDKGWFAFVNGQYVIGAYRINTPHKLMNLLCYKEVTNANTESYGSLAEEQPFIPKKELKCIK